MTWPADRSRDGGIDEIPLPEGQPGRLFLCGKHAIGPDPEALLARVGATTVVCLNETYELDGRYPDYVAWLAANAPARATHHPIADLHAPGVDDLSALVDQLRKRLDAGEGLVVHCGAGIGRSGTIAVALLVSMGVALEEALATVRAHRPMAGPEVGAQSEVLAAFADSIP
jgi:protein-tyrosine phosphatase